MKALVWNGTRDVTFEDLPEPEPAAGEVVFEVERAGICGSDLHGYRGHPGPRVPPLVLGHEVVGSAGGADYTVYPLIGCGECEHCLAGETVLEVERAGICGSDLHGYRGHPGPRVPPLVLGHEVVGRIDGAAYAVYPLIGCGDRKSTRLNSSH